MSTCQIKDIPNEILSPSIYLIEFLIFILFFIIMFNKNTEKNNEIIFYLIRFMRSPDSKIKNDYRISISIIFSFIFTLVQLIFIFTYYNLCLIEIEGFRIVISALCIFSLIGMTYELIQIHSEISETYSVLIDRNKSPFADVWSLYRDPIINFTLFSIYSFMFIFTSILIGEGAFFPKESEKWMPGYYVFICSNENCLDTKSISHFLLKNWEDPIYTIITSSKATIKIIASDVIRILTFDILEETGNGINFGIFKEKQGLIFYTSIIFRIYLASLFFRLIIYLIEIPVKLLKY